MGKIQQLQRIAKAGLPTPAFVAVSYADFKNNGVLHKDWKLTFPVVVRSSYTHEDGDNHSHAGQYTTVLKVTPARLSQSIETVFKSYPDPTGTVVIIQEMIDPEVSGVLFAFKHSVWKGEWGQGLGEQIVGGKVIPNNFLLPRFSSLDVFWARFYSGFWKGGPGMNKRHRRAFMKLAVYTRKLHQIFSAEGLDIEFAIAGNEAYILQSRPVTTSWEAEEVLTAANHKEILPPHPSALMRGIITASGKRLFQYYQVVDPSLPDRSFIHRSTGMPWINLSALLDVMVAWGLSTSLVSRSVGAVDVYQVGMRPWISVGKMPVFFRLIRRQLGVAKRVRDWVNHQRGHQHWLSEQRKVYWDSDPGLAAQLWVEHFTDIYVQLVEHMQDLTAAMSAPVALLDRLGLLSKVSVALQQKSSSTDYLLAFSQLEQGQLPRENFLRRYGHRGFYESDVGQKRFCEFDEKDWDDIFIGKTQHHIAQPKKRVPKKKKRGPFKPIVDLIHTREWLRHMTMYFFWTYRKEMLAIFAHREFNSTDFSQLSPQVLVDLLRTGEEHLAETEVEPILSGWDLNTFLANRMDRRVVWPSWYGSVARHGIGIYPGQVEGTVWRVKHAGANLEPPAVDGPIILVADALDPGWVPYFSRVNGVVAYVGGLLSHASIMLREVGIPSVTQISEELVLETGDYLRIDGRNGKVEKVEM